MSLLKHFPKPLLDDLIHGRWLPIVGAGMSLNARTPPGKKLPGWLQLAAALEDDMKDFESSSPIDGISAYEHIFGRTRLVERLFDILLVREAVPGDAHREFCSLPFQIVCTTNFDFLLEDQYKVTPRAVYPVYPVIGEDQLSMMQPDSVTILLKLHGDLHHPERMIITEADYDGFLVRYPLLATYLSNQLITKTAMLIGYSLDDPDFRQIWHVVTQRLGRNRRPAYALMVGASASDVDRFARRGVHVINLPGRKARYGEILATAFAELRDCWLPGVIGASAVKEEGPLRELKMPFDASTRLCFFALPVDQLASYRDKVFPAVEAAGFVPVTADDVVSPGDSIAAKIEALIERATAVVVEPTTPGTRSEMFFGLSRLKGVDSISARRRAPFRLIIVREAGAHVAFDAAGVEVLIRPPDWLDEPEPFSSALVERLRLAVPNGEQSRGNEALRLLNSDEYNAAIIAALSHLEAILRQRLDKEPWDEVRRPMTLRSLVDRAAKAGLIGPEGPAFVADWIPLRNRIVHTGAHASKNQAFTVVEGVRRILRE
jgi:SIR2-like protein